MHLYVTFGSVEALLYSFTLTVTLTLFYTPQLCPNNFKHPCSNHCIIFVFIFFITHVQIIFKNPSSQVCEIPQNVETLAHSSANNFRTEVAPNLIIFNTLTILKTLSVPWRIYFIFPPYRMSPIKPKYRVTYILDIDITRGIGPTVYQSHRIIC